ncbi:MAG TPA: hypothetical protein VK509_05750 [Polyangiales bacterium]|nr:hypothetical protein [Polyangiales bacterium]
MTGCHPSSRSIAGSLACAFALCTLLAGCKSIVGIEDREHDESRDDGGPKGGTGGKSGRGGNGGRGGSGGNGGKSGSRSDGSVPDMDGATDAMVSDGGAGDAGDAMVTPEDPCDLYCTTVLENCKDAYAVYASMQLCKAVCAKLPLGDLSAKDPLGNSVACRLDQARLAEVTAEPWDHCPRASPGGAGICGDNCESYCMLDTVFCPDNDDPECLAKCPGLRDLDDERASFDDSTFDVVAHHDGDFMQCRLVHVSSAAVSPAAHCWHAELTPFPHPDPKITDPNPCADVPSSVPRCKDYCRLNTTVCSGDLAQYDSEKQCVKLCESLDKGTNGDKGSQNTIGCRRNHSYNAMRGGTATHCPHSGPGGHSVCGSNCDSYCTEVAGACSTQFAAKYADKAACMTECTAIPDNGDPYTVAGGKAGSNKFFCRLYHTALAFEDANECASALGGGPCQ